MADVSIWVPVIAAGAGIIGATISQVTAVVRDARQDKRDRRERSGTMTRDACVALLRAAGEVRTLTESICSYRGNATGMMERVEQARSNSEATRVHAAEVGMQVTALAGAADQLASAANDLVDDIVRNMDPNQGLLIDKPDAAKLVKCIAAFRDEAVRWAAN
jgi:hypothetical protein